MYDPKEMDAKGVESYLTNSLLGMPLSKKSVGEDLYRRFIWLLGTDYVGFLYIQRGRTYLDQIVMIKQVPIMTIRIRKGAGFRHGYFCENDIYQGFRVAMDGLLAQRISQALLQS